MEQYYRLPMADLIDKKGNMFPINVSVKERLKTRMVNINDCPAWRQFLQINGFILNFLCWHTSQR